MVCLFTTKPCIAILFMLAAICAARGERPILEREQLALASGGNATARDAELRAQRLKALSRSCPVIAFIKRHPIRPSFYAYTEGQSDAQRERHFIPGSKLCLWRTVDGKSEVEELLSDPHGVIRDLDVSYDGQRLLFAWKKGDRDDDYHLYEMEVATKQIRQLTFGRGVADYEGIYLPDGDIMFSSSRCVQTVDCWWTEASNMYKCDKDGQYLRRIGFDQVHTVHPSVLNDGTVVYTRWDYNDRGQVFPQALFQMNPDGTGQTEYYGNNSYFPTVIDHARAIPGSEKLVAVLHGHHTWQAGKLAIIDRSKGTQEAAGVQLIAPVRETKAVRKDAYGQGADLFRHPYPISETEFIVSYTADGNARKNKTPFGLYWFDINGNRELLTLDAEISCNNPIPLKKRLLPHVKPSLVDYTKDYGTYFMQDIYVGPGLMGVARGTIKALRVVALEFRAAGVGSNSSRGEAGGALVSTPISIGNGAWDVKRILGTAKVYQDGSAMFRAPANTPVYFQALDDKGQVVQTMRSWSTLMPGETFGCIGCHEDKLSTPMVQKSTLAAQAGAQELEPFYGSPRGFSFKREIQPILDDNCITCHVRDGPEPAVNASDKAFSLTGNDVKDGRSGRNWTTSYLRLTGAWKKDGKFAVQGKDDSPLVNWVSSQSRPSMLPPYHRGAAKSGLIKQLREGHGKVKLSTEEMHKLCAWIDLGVPFCGDYMEANCWNQKQKDFYLRYQQKRERLAEEVERNIAALINQRADRNGQ
jgi:hypothetical protein